MPIQHLTPVGVSCPTLPSLFDIELVPRAQNKTNKKLRAAVLEKTDLVPFADL